MYNMYIYNIYMHYTCANSLYARARTHQAARSSQLASSLAIRLVYEALRY